MTEKSALAWAHMFPPQNPEGIDADSSIRVRYDGSVIDDRQVVFAVIYHEDLLRLDRDLLDGISFNGTSDAFFVGTDQDLRLYVDTDATPDFIDRVREQAEARGLTFLNGIGDLREMCGANGDIHAPAQPAFIENGMGNIPAPYAMAFLDARRPPVDNAPDFIETDAFVIPAGRYMVLDGDTIQTLTEEIGPDGRTERGFRIRFRSIAAPEKVKRDMHDNTLRSAGIDLHADSPGARATRQLRKFTRKRDLLCIPSGRHDTYGRMIADIAVFPEPGKSDNFADAISLERCMLARGMCKPFPEEILPPLHPRGSYSGLIPD